VLNQRNLVGVGHEVRPAVERIDALGVAKTDAPQHALHAARLPADFADHTLGVLG